MKPVCISQIHFQYFTYNHTIINILCTVCGYAIYVHIFVENVKGIDYPRSFLPQFSFLKQSDLIHWKLRVSSSSQVLVSRAAN